MKRKRRKFSTEFKAQVVLEAIKSQKTINQIAQEEGVLTVQVSTWKNDLQELGPVARAVAILLAAQAAGEDAPRGCGDQSQAVAAADERGWHRGGGPEALDEPAASVACEVSVFAAGVEGGSGRPSLVRRHLPRCVRPAGCLAAGDLRFAPIPTSPWKRAMPTLWR